MSAANKEKPDGNVHQYPDENNHYVPMEPKKRGTNLKTLTFVVLALVAVVLLLTFVPV